MKILFPIFVLLATIFGCNPGNRNGISITVKSSESSYHFEASYPERKTKKVQDYVKKTLGQDELFAHSNGSLRTEVILSDTLKFSLSSATGYIAIDFKKQDNTYAMYKKLENMCQGIKEQLK